MTQYVVGKCHVLKPGVNDKKEAAVEFVPDLLYGIHSNNVDAKRSYCAAFYPEMNNREKYNDAFIKRFFHGETWGNTNAKIIKYKDQS
jgi:hypothetical protein